MASSPRWLDIVRHRLRGQRSPYLIVVQHHAVPADTVLAAPVTRPRQGDVDVLAPRVTVDGTEYRARLLDIAAVPRTMIKKTFASASFDADAIMNAMDILLHGTP